MEEHPEEGTQDQKSQDQPPPNTIQQPNPIQPPNQSSKLEQYTCLIDGEILTGNGCFINYFTINDQVHHHIIMILIKSSWPTKYDKNRDIYF